MSPPFQLTVLGQTRLTGPEGVVDLNSRKLSGLLAYLACGGSRGHSREHLMALLWGGHGDAQARQNLRQALHRLRSVLGKTALAGNGNQIALAADVLACDVVAFEGLLEAGDLDALRAAAALYGGPLLADLAIAEPAWDEWVTAERRRLEDLALQAMIGVAAADLETGNPEKAIEAARRALAINPLREDGHRIILQALATAGRKAEALAHYAELEGTLKRELGVAPDAATQALAAELRAAQHASSAPSPKIRAAAPVMAVPQSLPAAPVAANVPSIPVPARAHTVPRAALWMRRAPHRPFYALGLLVCAFAVLAAAGASVTWPWSKELAPTWPSDTAARRNDYVIPVAVLPLRLLTPENPAAVSFAGYIEEEITNYLSHFPVMSVPPRQMMREIGSPERPLSYWSKAGLHYAMGGSVWADRETLRLSVHMVDLATQLQTWAKHYEYPIAEWPAQRESVLRRIAINMNFESIRREGMKPYADAERPTVRELLARGWKSLQANGDTAEFAQAATYFGEALKRDPNSTHAMVGLGGYKLLATSNLLGEREIQVSEGEALLRQALSKGSDSFTLHYYLGMLYNLKNDAPMALQELERTISLNPSFAPGHAYRGRVLIKLSRYAEALESVQYASRLTDGKQLAPGWAFWRGMALLELGQDQSAGEAFRYAFEMQPRLAYFIAGMAAFCALSGDMDMARRYAIDWRARTPGQTDTWRLLEMNKGPGDQPLSNRFGRGLRLALEAASEQKKAEHAP